MTGAGSLLRARRQQAALGLRTFAALIGERASTVSAIESGFRAPWRSVELLTRVAEVLGEPLTASLWQEPPSTNGHPATTDVASVNAPFSGELLWWWTNDDGVALDSTAASGLAEFVGAHLTECRSGENGNQVTWPSLTELAIEWRVRQLLGRRMIQLAAAPVDVEAALECGAGVRLEVLAGMAPRFSVKACAVRENGAITLYVDRIIADSRPMASYRDLLATCFAPAVLCEVMPADAGWFFSLQNSPFWTQALRDCQRFSLAMLLPARPVLIAAEAAYQELIGQLGWTDFDTAARSVRNRLAEQFAVPPALVHRRLMGWPCHIYGRIAQALVAEETTLPPCDWLSHERVPVQRELFAK